MRNTKFDACRNPSWDEKYRRKICRWAKSEWRRPDFQQIVTNWEHFRLPTRPPVPDNRERVGELFIIENEKVGAYKINKNVFAVAGAVEERTQHKQTFYGDVLCIGRCLRTRVVIVDIGPERTMQMVNDSMSACWTAFKHLLLCKCVLTLVLMSTMCSVCVSRRVNVFAAVHASMVAHTRPAYLAIAYSKRQPAMQLPTLWALEEFCKWHSAIWALMRLNRWKIAGNNVGNRNRVKTFQSIKMMQFPLGGGYRFEYEFADATQVDFGWGKTSSRGGPAVAHITTTLLIDAPAPIKSSHQMSDRSTR